jgi:hypothetical protein
MATSLRGWVTLKFRLGYARLFQVRLGYELAINASTILFILNRPPLLIVSNFVKRHFHLKHFVQN